MNLDVNTLFLVTIYVEAILGLLLLFAWIQNAQIRAVARWGCAHLIRASSVVLFGLYGSVSQAISIDLANALLFVSFAVTWTGARVFDGRPPLPVYIVAGPVAWLIICHLPAFAGDLDLRFLLASGSSRLTLGSRPMSSGVGAASPGVPLARDLHAARARRAVPAAHAAVRHGAVGADQPDVRERLAHGAEL